MDSRADKFGSKAAPLGVETSGLQNLSHLLFALGNEKRLNTELHWIAVLKTAQKPKVLHHFDLLNLPERVAVPLTTPLPEDTSCQRTVSQSVRGLVPVLRRQSVELLDPIM